MTKYKHNDYYGYINKLQAYAISHPEWFWSEESKAQEARQWLHDNGGSAIIDTIYEATPDNLKPTDYRLKTNKIINQEIKEKIHSGQNKFLDTAGAMALQVSPFLAGGAGFVSAPVATVLGVTGGVLGGLGTNKLTNLISKGRYNTFGDFIRQGKDLGQTGNTLAEFVNPGAFLGGLSGGVVGMHWKPVFSFNNNGAYRILPSKKDFQLVRSSGEIGSDSPYTVFTFGQPNKRVQTGNYLIEAPSSNPNFHFARLDYASPKERLFTSDNLKVGESVTPVITERNVPITLDAGQVNIYKRVPLGYWLKNVRGNGKIGTANYGNIKFIRNVGELPTVENGKVLLSPEKDYFTNMTWDQSFITHKNYSTRPGEDYVIIDPLAFEGRQFKSIEPMDSFTENVPIDPKYITILSGNPEKLSLAKERGFGVIEDPRLIELFSIINNGNKQESIGGINLNKKGFGTLDGVEDYDRLANTIIKERFGDVTFPSIKALENSVGLKSGVISKEEGRRSYLPFEEAKNEKRGWIPGKGYAYPNGRNVYLLTKDPSPWKVMSEYLFYDPATHAESNLVGAGKPTKQDVYSSPELQERISRVSSFPLLGVIKLK